MFRSRSGKPSGSIGTLISSGSAFEGNLECDGAFKIDGKITGNVKANSDVYIGKTAAVKGNVCGNNIFLSGTVVGQVHADGMLRLYTEASLTGDIEVHSFVADEGALFQGKCHMIETKPAEKTKIIKKSSVSGKTAVSEQANNNGI